MDHKDFILFQDSLLPLRLDDQENEPGSENKVVLEPGRGNPVLGIDE